MSTNISILSIDTADRLRTLDPDWVALLAEEMKIDGQTDPIRVAKRGDGYKLIKGARRIAAALLNDWDTIDAKVEDEAAFADDAVLRLAEIKGHLIHGELTPLDRAITVAAWCNLYKEAKGTPKPGPKSKAFTTDEDLDELSAKLALNWSEAAQKALSISRREVFRALKVARISGEIRNTIALHPVAKVQRELLLLADLTPARQKAVVDLLTAEEPQAVTVTEAIALLDHAPAARPLPAHERIYERFVRLQPNEREKFYALNRTEIETWLAKQAAKKAA